LKDLSEKMKFVILASAVWPIFLFLYLWDRWEPLPFEMFIRKFILMGVLPLLIVWVIWWIAQGLKKNLTK